MDTQRLDHVGHRMSESAQPQIQFRVTERGSDDRVSGGDDAALVVTVPLSVVNEQGFDPTTEFMRGRLKASGHTGLLFEVLSNGDASDALNRLASRP